MSLRVDARKTELIDKVAEQTRRRLGASNAAAGAAAEAFVRRFYANVAVDDVIAFSPEDLYGAAIALWQFGRSRKKGLAKVRVYNPRLAEHGWASPHTIVEIINDDMPFLVDSVSVEMTRRELGVHLLIHPIVHVERDGSGALKGVAEAGSARNAGESFMHIEIDRQGGAETLAELQRAIESVLVDVRVTVADWKDMTARAREVITELKDRPPPLDAEEVKTAHDFLTWMADDHFTFLGYREYEFSGKGGKARANVVPGRGLGLCHDDEFVIFEGLRNLAALPPDVQEFVRQPTLLKITKANRRSTVHRAVHLDTIGVKKFDAAGNVTGERLFLGLFTSAAYSQSPLAIPLLADKVRRLVARAGFTSKSHDGKALLHILETFSRNELFQASEDELFEMAIGILHLQDRQRTALFVRKDAFERFVSCFVYVPRDRYTTELRLRFQKIIEKAFNGTQAAFSSHFPDDTALVRVHIVIKTTPGKIPSYDLAEINRLLMEASRGFIDRLKETLIEAHGEERGLAVFRRFAGAFPTAYRERFDPQSAAEDIGKIEEVLGDATSLALNLYRPLDAAEHELRFRIFRKGQPVPLSGVLPMLENMGLKAISESPYQIAPTGGEPVWMHDFALVAPEVAEIDLSSIKPNFEDCFARIWGGTVESDGFNRLVIGAGLSAREVTVLRAYARYLRQVGIPFSQAYMEDTLARNPKVVRRLVDLFVCVHNPAAREKIEVKSAGLIVEIEHLFDEVTNLDEDRILRRFLNLVRATLRTNFFQTGPDGQPKPYLALKIDSQAVDEMPLPRPLVEIFVYSPQVEGIHLRGGRVARGGIRWSDRREDFRTEILGLMKAQMVKNTVIVPVGSKGGFFVKRPAPADAGREAVLAEGIACYKIFIRGLLDLTDNIAPSANVPPKDVVRRDSDDPYLVVAADKGTATFSDIANGVSREYGFGLDDAFASGGSAGYDHKGMGFTARGA
ncbi:MAG: NAD-glutamate dehydrogenase, partial [Rhodospirillales bacterium]|nr:NAD-glutamate dehydrogenase [Rhodospirillales bacterium]